ncbi:MAG: SdiA-regulated domain-containing protein [Gemmatimonadaceae bacterium]
MKRMLALGASFAALAGCRPTEGSLSRSDSAVVAGRIARLERSLADPSAAPAGLPLARWVLPNTLREISGLAAAPDGRLFAHGDEQGHVSVIDPRGGIILKQFRLGSGVRADFEGITLADSTIYMVASNGTLYEFQEGANHGRVSFRVHDTQLGRECEFEGVAFERDSMWLVLPCKRVGKKELKDQLVIYRWKLDPAASPRFSVLTIPLAQVVGTHGWKGLHPSDITIDPTTGAYVIVAAQERALIQIAPNGAVISAVALPSGHTMAEGIAITRDGLLYISDEASNRAASITLYRWPFAPTTPGTS